MRKLLAITMAAGIILSGAVVSASPVTDFTKGSLEVEFGSTMGSEVSGKGQLNPKADGKEGFKYGAAFGLGHNTAIQFKGGKFWSEDTTVSLHGIPLTSYAKSDIREVNLVYKLNDHVSAAVGYVENIISYGTPLVKKEKPSSLHIGLAASQEINSHLKTFAGLMIGHDVLFWETGFGYKLTKETSLNIAYGERHFKDVPISIPALAFNDILDYKMKGVTFMVSHKFR